MLNLFSDIYALYYNQMKTYFQINDFEQIFYGWFLHTANTYIIQNMKSASIYVLTFNDIGLHIATNSQDIMQKNWIRLTNLQQKL